MSAHPPRLPIGGVAWISLRLYRVASDDGRSGRAVEVDGWDAALETAWQQLVEAQPGVSGWVSDYLDRCGDERVVLSFGDTTRIVGRRGHGSFTVSYPAELLLATGDRVSAMREAILVALDRHVGKRSPGLPLLSSLVGSG
ncbi:hypothetical protein QWY28_22495 [Nocardioides sp. SOB77]|uniref:Uncharacterized protein n=1 Tax=Nocardioides oceani TaxID=3058369 RepID=A0ABT8FM47_9ACTN|nr:hypothetical protein [Nocardioides oceani]MDN4175748.1 hypothetical protein [Nocardioides oceani]